MSYNNRFLHAGPLHLIVRNYRDDPQYGFLAGGRRGTRTLDIWVRQTLFTLRWRRW